MPSTAGRRLLLGAALSGVAGRAFAQSWRIRAPGARGGWSR